MLVAVPAASARRRRWLALRRVRISPLGVSRRAAPPPPSAWRLLTLGVGLALFVAGLLATTAKTIGAPAYPGLLIVMVGLIVAGPWLTAAAARLVRAGPERRLAAAGHAAARGQPQGRVPGGARAGAGRVPRHDRRRR